MTKIKPIPPVLATKLLLTFLRRHLKEEVSGDLEEKFYVTLKNKSLRRARLAYWYQVFHYMRPFAIRNLSSLQLNHYDMFRNYFKTGWRSLSRQKMYSAIKIGGFALGIAACLLIALFIQDELNYDQQIADKEFIYRVVEVYNDEGDVERGVSFEAPFAAALKSEFPEIEKAGRYNFSELFGAGGNEIRRAENVDNNYEEGFVYVDQELLEIMKTPMIYGNPAHCLDKPRSIVITRRKADKYFPGENPVGKLLIVNNDITYSVGGVIDNFPSTSHMQFDFLITLNNLEFWPGEQTFWGATNYPTYIKVKPGTNIPALTKKMSLISEKYLLPHLLATGRANAKEKINKISFELQPVADIHLRSAGISDGLTHGDIRFVWLFGAVAAFILVIACINFINLSTARSANRAKEVGLRKTVGSLRSSIINQFLTESLLFSFLSFLLGILIASVALPYFNMLSNKSLQFPWTEWWLLPVTLGTAIAVGMLAGLYPALYLSGFRPIDVLKGKLSMGSKSSPVRSTLVIFQFTTSIILIISTFVIYRQVQFILTAKLGFDKEQVLLVQGANTLGKSVSVFKNEVLQLSGVKSATISEYLPVKGTKRNGNGFWNEGKKTVDQSVGGQFWRVDHDYVKTLGMKLVDGRDFSPDHSTDSLSVIINQSMAKELGLKDPVGKRIMNWEVFTVIGVVEDFHFESMRDEISPLVMTLGESNNIVSIKLKTKDVKSLIGSVTTVWNKLAPHQAIRYSFLDQQYARMYQDVERMGRIFTTFAALAIIVACLGLFALASFMVEQRGKEISIRLVLGASLKSIFNLLTTNFIRLILISCVLAIPIGWYLMNKWLEGFIYKTEITWDVFVISSALAVIIALVTISYQSIRAGLVSPSQNLRSE